MPKVDLRDEGLSPPETARWGLLSDMMEAISAGRTFEEVFDIVYDRLRGIVPYDRLGVALLTENEDQLSLVAVRSDRPVKLQVGFSAPRVGSSLDELLRNGRPRTINDLEAYLRSKPHSVSTQKIVEEGMRSSLTAPLRSRGRPVGVMFFSSRKKGAYAPRHEWFLTLLSGHVALAVERSLLMRELSAKGDTLRRTLEDLRKHQEELIRAQSLAAVGEMAATIAHEVKNPLAGISGAMQILGDAFPRGDAKRQVVDEILKQVRRLDEIIRDLLLYARPWRAAPQPFDLVALAARVLSSAQKVPGRSGIHFVTESSGDSHVEADPQQLEHVLVNLVQNSCEAISGRGRVTVSVAGDADRVTLTVKDTGGGIPEDVRGRVFDPFVTTKARGTGLGLALSRKIVEAHGGTILVDRTDRTGTEISVHLHRRFPGAKA